MSDSPSSSNSYDGGASVVSTAPTSPIPWSKPSGGSARRKLRAVIMRAGTSKGLFVHLSDLPEDRLLWGPVLCSAMGSPDPFAKQLNGMGGGSSTQSKVAIISPSDDPRADVDYLFVQVPVDGTELDFSGNCGNMASGVGPFAVEEGLVKVENVTAESEVTVRIRNVNTDRIVHSTLSTFGQTPIENGSIRVDGVSGFGSPIRLDFMDPAGSMTGQLLPTGSPTDSIVLADSRSITVSCVDAANPFVFVPLVELGLPANPTILELQEPTLVACMMEIRALAAVKMGLARNIGEAALRMGAPKIALVGPSVSPDTDITVRAFSMGKPHPTIQMTGAVCVGAASAIPGSVVNAIVQGKQDIVIGHACGTMMVRGEAAVVGDEISITSGSVFRTARRLMEGSIML